jgi:hypothetical protein
MTTGAVDCISSVFGTNQGLGGSARGLNLQQLTRNLNSLEFLATSTENLKTYLNVYDTIHEKAECLEIHETEVADENLHLEFFHTMADGFMHI